MPGDMRTLGAALAAGAALCLSGCGSERAEPTPADAYAGQGDLGSGAPDCAATWVAGQPLPADYRGCNDGGAFHMLPPDCGGCGLASYEADDGAYYAHLGEVIVAVPDLLTDPGFAAAVDACNDLTASVE